MLIGFVLLVSACGYDACEALPVSERIYPTKMDCETMANRIHKVRPNVVLLCGEVHRRFRTRFNKAGLQHCKLAL